MEVADNNAVDQGQSENGLASAAEIEAFLDKNHANAVKEEAAGEVDPEAEESESEPAEPESEGDEESPEDEGEAEEGEENPEAEAESAKKPGKWKKLKLEAREAKQNYESLLEQHSELVDHAKFFADQVDQLSAQLEAQKLESQRLRSRLEEFRLDEFGSAEARRAAELEREVLQYRMQQQRAQEAAKLQQQAMTEQQLHQRAAEIRAVAEAHGLDPLDLYKSHRAVSHTGESLQSVAERVAMVRGATAKRKQAEGRVSRPAPKVAPSGSSGRPGDAGTVDDILRFLEERNS